MRRHLTEEDKRGRGRMHRKVALTTDQEPAKIMNKSPREREEGKWTMRHTER